MQRRSSRAPKARKGRGVGEKLHTIDPIGLLVDRNSKRNEDGCFGRDAWAMDVQTGTEWMNKRDLTGRDFDHVKAGLGNISEAELYTICFEWLGSGRARTSLAFLGKATLDRTTRMLHKTFIF